MINQKFSSLIKPVFCNVPLCENNETEIKAMNGKKSTKVSRRNDSSKVTTVKFV